MVIMSGKNRHFPLPARRRALASYSVVGRGGTSGSGMPLDDMFPRSLVHVHLRNGWGW